MPNGYKYIKPKDYSVFGGPDLSQEEEEILVNPQPPAQIQPQINTPEAINQIRNMPNYDMTTGTIPTAFDKLNFSPEEQQLIQRKVNQFQTPFQQNIPSGSPINALLNPKEAMIYEALKGGSQPFEDAAEQFRTGGKELRTGKIGEGAVDLTQALIHTLMTPFTVPYSAITSGINALPVEYTDPITGKKVNLGQEITGGVNKVMNLPFDIVKQGSALTRSVLKEVGLDITVNTPFANKLDNLVTEIGGLAILGKTIKEAKNFVKKQINEVKFTKATQSEIENWIPELKKKQYEQPAIVLNEISKKIEVLKNETEPNLEALKTISELKTKVENEMLNNVQRNALRGLQKEEPTTAEALYPLEEKLNFPQKKVYENAKNKVDEAGTLPVVKGKPSDITGTGKIEKRTPLREGKNKEEIIKEEPQGKPGEGGPGLVSEILDTPFIKTIKDEFQGTNTVEQIKKAQDIVGKDAFEQRAKEITEGKEPFIAGVFVEALANDIVKLGKMPEIKIEFGDKTQPKFVDVLDKETGKEYRGYGPLHGEALNVIGDALGIKDIAGEGARFELLGDETGAFKREMIGEKPIQKPVEPIKPEVKKTPEQRLKEEIYELVKPGLQKNFRPVDIQIAREKVQKLREMGINASIEKTGKKQYGFFIDKKRVGAKDLGAKYQPKKDIIIKENFPDEIKRPYKDLSNEIVDRQEAVIANRLIDETDLPTGYGIKQLEKGYKDLSEGRDTTKEAMLIRNAAEDIIKNGKEIMPGMGNEKQFIPKEDIAKMVDEYSQFKSTFENAKVGKFDQMAIDAWRRLNDPKNFKLESPSPFDIALQGARIIRDLTIVGSYHFWKGARTFAEWSKKMIDEHGPEVEKYLKEVWKNVRREVAPSVKEFEKNQPKLVLEQKKRDLAKYAEMTKRVRIEGREPGVRAEHGIEWLSEKIQVKEDLMSQGKSEKVAQQVLDARSTEEYKKLRDDGTQSWKDAYKESELYKNISEESLLELDPKTLRDKDGRPIVFNKAQQIRVDMIATKKALDIVNNRKSLGEELSSEQLAKLDKDLIDLVKLQALAKNNVREAARIMEGQRRKHRLNPDTYKALQEIAKEIKKPEALKDIVKIAQPNLGDKFWWVWYNTVLSNPLTDLANIFGNTTQLVSEVVTQLPYDPINVTAGLAKGLKEGAINAAKVWKDEKEAQSKYGWERLQQKAEVFPTKGKWTTRIKNTLAPTSRLAIEDAFFRSVFENIRERQASSKLAKDFGFTRQEIVQNIEKIIKGEDVQNPVVDRIGLERLQKEVDAIEKYATEMVFQKPLGKYGASFQHFLNTVWPVKMLGAPFARIAINLTKASLKNSPFGYYKMFGKQFKNLTKLEQQDIIRRATAGTMFYAGLFATLDQTDTEIVGDFQSVPPTTRELLIKSGYRENSVIIHNKDGSITSVPFQNISPFNILLGTIGSMYVKSKWGKQSNQDTDAIQEVTKAFLGMANSLGNQSFLQSTSALISSLHEGDANVLRDMLIRAATPNIVSLFGSADLEALGVEPRKIYEAEKTVDAIRNRLQLTTDLDVKSDVFGEDRVTTYRRFPYPATTAKNNIAKLLIETNIGIGDLSNPKVKGKEIYSERQYNKYKKIYRRELYKLLNKNYDYLKSLQDKGEFGIKTLEKIIDKKKDIAKEMAKYIIKNNGE